MKICIPCLLTSIYQLMTWRIRASRIVAIWLTKAIHTPIQLETNRYYYGLYYIICKGILNSYLNISVIGVKS